MNGSTTNNCSHRRLSRRKEDPHVSESFYNNEEATEEKSPIGNSRAKKLSFPFYMKKKLAKSTKRSLKRSSDEKSDRRLPLFVIKNKNSVPSKTKSSSKASKKITQLFRKSGESRPPILELKLRGGLEKKSEKKSKTEFVIDQDHALHPSRESWGCSAKSIVDQLSETSVHDINSDDSFGKRFSFASEKSLRSYCDGSVSTGSKSNSSRKWRFSKMKQSATPEAKETKKSRRSSKKSYKDRVRSLFSARKKFGRLKRLYKNMSVSSWRNSNKKEMAGCSSGPSWVYQVDKITSTNSGSMSGSICKIGPITRTVNLSTSCESFINCENFPTDDSKTAVSSELGEELAKEEDPRSDREPKSVGSTTVRIKPAVREKATEAKKNEALQNCKLYSQPNCECPENLNFVLKTTDDLDSNSLKYCHCTDGVCDGTAKKKHKMNLASCCGIVADKRKKKNEDRVQE